jgi:hypothetical protein
MNTETKTRDFVNVLLKLVEKKGSPYISVGAMDYDTAELVCAVNNLGLAIWKPRMLLSSDRPAQTTRQLYVSTINCERYLAARDVA